MIKSFWTKVFPAFPLLHLLVDLAHLNRIVDIDLNVVWLLNWLPSQCIVLTLGSFLKFLDLLMLLRLQLRRQDTRYVLSGTLLVKDSHVIGRGIRDEYLVR